MSPMCTYSALPSGPEAGAPHDFHLAHYASRAAGGAGLVPAPIPNARDYQSAYAARVRAATGVATAAGRIDDPEWANELVETGQADAVFIGRALLRDASWSNNAAALPGARGRFIKQYDYAL
jgi:2,4-dienoyl-CoA reductase-like NADH-dependent reductase (Old Yellow Enzyme family)